MVDWARESSGYQIILDEGRVGQAIEDILRLGTRRFGPPEGSTQRLLESINDLDRLRRILERFGDAPATVSDWKDLLATE
jgi:hypothetical protein